MGLSYLGGRSWTDLSREERLFCSHLYHDIRSAGRENEFVQWLAKPEAKQKEWKPGASRGVLLQDQEWEIGYEVCFYRDLIHALKKSPDASKYAGINHDEYPRKRTFDLCLFSANAIVIVEAKVHEGFEVDQVGSIEEDKSLVVKLLEEVKGTGTNVPEVMTVALASSSYFENVKTFGRRVGPLLDETFDARVTWNAVGAFLKNEFYEEADKRYRH